MGDTNRMTEAHAAWIVSDPGIRGGKPCVRGTRISVAHILEVLSNGASRDDVLKAYPNLTREGFDAALAYAARAVDTELVYDLQVPA